MRPTLSPEVTEALYYEFHEESSHDHDEIHNVDVDAASGKITVTYGVDNDNLDSYTCVAVSHGNSAFILRSPTGNTADLEAERERARKAGRDTFSFTFDIVPAS